MKFTYFDAWRVNYSVNLQTSSIMNCARLLPARQNTTFSETAQTTRSSEHLHPNRTARCLHKKHARTH